jgi:hypothetical protein
MRPAHQSVVPAFQRISPEYAVVVHQGILIQLWRVATSIEGVRLVRKTLADFDSQIELTMVVIEDGATRPDRGARSELDALGKELAPRFAAVVFEGHGFKAAAVRAVMTSIGLFTRSALPSRIFSSTDGAIEWMMRAYPDVPGVDSVDGVLARLRPPAASQRRPREAPR